MRSDPPAPANVRSVTSRNGRTACARIVAIIAVGRSGKWKKANFASDPQSLVLNPGWRTKDQAPMSIAAHHLIDRVARDIAAAALSHR
jgi:hypothetical protein